MAIKLSDHFGYGRLLRFVAPSIVMMVFTSIYGVVDGLFVSNVVGETAFAAINFIYPVIMILGSVGFMLGTGGSAIVAQTLGAGDSKRAKEYFTLIVISTFVLGAAFSAAGLLFLRPLGALMGADGELLDLCVEYGRILLFGNVAFMLQNVFQGFFVTAEKPKLGLLAIVCAGLTNIVLDALFIKVFGWGVSGAAWATVSGQIVGGLLPVVYFACKNSSLLRFTKTRFYGKMLVKTCTNGSSELLGNISLSIVSILYNVQLLKIAGQYGVDVYGFMMYVGFVFVAVFIGYSMGSAPLVSYHYGAEDLPELKNLTRKSLTIVSAFAVMMTALSLIFSRPLARIFVGHTPELMEMAVEGMRIYAISFLFSGFSIYASSFFTALGNGVVSAVISFMRTLVFQVAAVLILPIFFGVKGIWWSIVVSEVVSLTLSAVFFFVKRKKYGY